MNSSWKPILLLLLPVAAVLLLLERALRSDPRHRNYEAFTEMVYSKASETQSRSAALPGQMTQQPVMGGVVVRGELPFRYGEGSEEAQRAGRELENPFGDESDVLRRGAEVYRIFCLVCHAVDGEGQGPVVKRGMLPPPALQGARAMAMPDGEMFHVLTRGQGNMASYAAQVSAADRWKVIRYVRSLQEGAR